MAPRKYVRLASHIVDELTREGHCTMYVYEMNGFISGNLGFAPSYFGYDDIKISDLALQRALDAQGIKISSYTKASILDNCSITFERK